MPDDLLDGIEEEPPPPSRWRPVVWGALTLGLLGLGSVLISHNTAASSVSAGFDSSFNPVVNRPLPTDGLSLGLGDNLLVGVSCPAVAGAPGVAAVAFRLENWGQANVVVTSMGITGSRHGLHIREYSSGGSCEQPAHGAVGGSLMPGGGQLYTFWFNTPAGCPASGKKIALDVRAQYLSGTTTKAVTRDVGQVYLTTCPVEPT